MKQSIKVMSIFGTRPEAIKMAPLVKELESREQVESLVCVTAQHREMLDQVLDAFSIRPDYDLDIMAPSQTLMHITVKALEGLAGVLQQARPDLVLVHGDTSTTFVAALAAFYEKIKVGHVEAGLRTGDPYSPFPEEMNRTLTTDIAALHFAPTPANAANLRREGVEQGIYITGNTVIDALSSTVRPQYTFDCPRLNQIDYQKERVILLTAHRRENYGRPFEQIMEAVKQVAAQEEEVRFVYPVHLSPYVRQTAQKYLGQISNIDLIEPLGVVDMHNLMARCALVMTDSGGIQEEAPSLGKPVLVLRRETERPEAVAAGAVRMAGVESGEIARQAATLLEDPAEYAKMAQAVNPYGDGFACRRIADAALYSFGLLPQPPANFEAGSPGAR